MSKTNVNVYQVCKKTVGNVNVHLLMTNKLFSLFSFAQLMQVELQSTIWENWHRNWQTLSLLRPYPISSFSLWFILTLVVAIEFQFDLLPFQPSALTPSVLLICYIWNECSFGESQQWGTLLSCWSLSHLTNSHSCSSTLINMDQIWRKIGQLWNVSIKSPVSNTRQLSRILF